MLQLDHTLKLGYKISYRANTSDENVIGHSFENDIYLPVLNHIDFNNGDVVLDIGAHIGTFSIMLNHVAKKDIKVFCFEASKETHHVLKTNVDSNNISNIEPLNMALTGLDQDTLKLYYDVEQGNWGHSVVHDFGGGFEEVENVTLHAFLKDKEVERVKLIKFNCEGAEIGIIMNTPLDDLKRIDNIVLLYHFDLTEGYTLDQLKKKLQDSGFDFFSLPTAKERGWIVGSREKGVGLKSKNRKAIIRNRLQTVKREITNTLVRAGLYNKKIRNTES